MKTTSFDERSEKLHNLNICVTSGYCKVGGFSCGMGEGKGLGTGLGIKPGQQLTELCDFYVQQVRLKFDKTWYQYGCWI